MNQKILLSSVTFHVTHDKSKNYKININIIIIHKCATYYS